MKSKTPKRPGSGQQWHCLRGLTTPAEEFNRQRHRAETKGRQTRRGKLARLYAGNARIIRERREALLAAIGGKEGAAV